MQRLRTVIVAASAGLALALGAGAAQALNLTFSDAGYTGPELDLSAFENGSYNFTFGPVALPGGITFTGSPGGGGNSGNGSVIGQGSYGLGVNGTFGGSAVYIGVDSQTGYAELEFLVPVASFGGYWNYAPDNGGDPATISAYDSGGGLLGAFNLEDVAPISTPGGFNAFEFRGLESALADIKTVRFGGNYILLAGTADGSVVPNEVPLPLTAPLLIAGIGLLGAAARRRAR